MRLNDAVPLRPRILGRAVLTLGATAVALAVAVLTASPRWHVVRRVPVPTGPHNLSAGRSLGGVVWCASHTRAARPRVQGHERVGLCASRCPRRKE